jgi:secreted Zn-dependent insulinase-like peptidase
LQVSKVLKAEESVLARVLDAGAGIEVRLPNPIPGDLNSATVNAYQYGTPDVSERVKLLMLSKMISGPAYDELRTKEQLGYIVFATVMPQRETLQMVMIVQGAKKNPDEVDTRIESVMDSFGNSLTNLSASEFSRWKASIRSSIAEDDQNMAQEADRLWEHISTGEECFNRRELSLEYLDSFTEVSELAKEFQVFRQKPRKLSMRVFGDHKLVGIPQPTAALQVLRGDNSTQKAVAGQGHVFFTPGGICRIRRQ